MNEILQEPIGKVTADNLLAVLESADANIAYAEERVENAKYNRDLAKINLEGVEAGVILTFSAVAKNQTELSAKVDANQFVQDAKIKLAMAEKNLNAAQREYNRQENRFTAARKIASMDAELSTYRK